MLGPVAGLALIAACAFPLDDGTSQGGDDQGTRDESASRLAEEVRTKGWIIFSARSPGGDWDLFVSRPDGSAAQAASAGRAA